MDEFEKRMRQGGDAAIVEAARFFMRDDPVHRSLVEIGGRLESLGIPYAVAGGMALVAHGYHRTTVDVDILVTQDGLRKIHEALDGLGYQPPFAASKNLRDTRTGVLIEFLIAGQYPGDGKPKPLSFPDPAEASVEIDGIRYVSLPALIELKLASGMTNPGRVKDLGDVQELIRARQLGPDFVEQLNPYVREKFTQLRSAIEGETNL